MQVRRTFTAALLGASLVAAAPAVASAHGGGGHRGGDQGGAQGQSYNRSDVPARVSTRVRRVETALDRAAAAVDDGNATGSASALKAVRSNLAAATKAAKKRASSDNGPDSFYAVATADDDVVDQVVSLYDGADDATVSALTDTLNAAISGRDDLVATIAALPAADGSNYGFVLDAIDNDVTDEIASIDDALADDTLSDQAKADLTDARAKLVATQTAVQGLNASQTSSSDESGTSTSAADDQDCPRGGRGPRGSNNGSGGSSTQEAPQT
jgi:hypothetical protein